LHQESKRQEAKRIQKSMEYQQQMVSNSQKQTEIFHELGSVLKEFSKPTATAAQDGEIEMLKQDVKEIKNNLSELLCMWKEQQQQATNRK